MTLTNNRRHSIIYIRLNGFVLFSSDGRLSVEPTFQYNFTFFNLFLVIGDFELFSLTFYVILDFDNWTFLTFFDANGQETPFVRSELKQKPTRKPKRNTENAKSNVAFSSLIWNILCFSYIIVNSISQANHSR